MSYLTNVNRLRNIDVSYSDKMFVADFNNDGVLDIAMINEKENNIGVFLGNQNGTYQSAQIFPVGKSPGKITGGDFNGDGNMDLAITNRESNNVTILLGDGQGGFIEPAGSPLNTPDPYDIVLTDFDGNGTLDLIVTNQSIGSYRFFKEMARGSSH